MRDLDDWRKGAACAEIDPEAWFPESGGDGGRKALKVCGGCPVRKQCLNFALTNGIRDGIFGGKTPTQRARMRRLVA